MRVLLMVMMAWVLAGCESPEQPQFSVPAGQYAQAFDAARTVLRSYRFSLDRVDAAAGVITTAHKSTAGIATPWDREQSTTSQEFDDLLNQQSRTVRVTFRPAFPSSAEPVVNQPVDPQEELIGRVEVIIYRMETPGVRSPSKAISLTTLSTDPVLVAEGVGGAYEVPVSQDTRLASTLAAAIERQLERAPIAASGSGTPPSPPSQARP
jgi:hypothetical protein